MDEPQPNTEYGVDAILAYADALENNLGIPIPEAVRWTLIGTRHLTFGIGIYTRSEASAFLAGMGAITGNEDLLRASCYFGLSSKCSEQLKAEAELMEQYEFITQAQLEEHLTRMASVLREKAEYERQAGEHLIAGSRAFD